MFNKIYANGCSFTKAGGLDQLNIQKKYKEILNINLDDYTEYAYPNIISKKLQIPIINEAISGGSLNRLIRTTYEYVYENQSTLSETLFILELPTNWRDEVYSNELDKLINICSHTIKNIDIEVNELKNYNIGDIKIFHKKLQSYFYNFVNTDFEYKKSMNNLLGLIYFLKYNNSNIILIDNTNFKKFLNSNNLKNDFNFISLNGEPMTDWFVKNKLTINDELGFDVNDGHAGIGGNEKIAEMILTYLNEKII